MLVGSQAGSVFTCTGKMGFSLRFCRSLRVWATFGDTARSERFRPHLEVVSVHKGLVGRIGTKEREESYFFLRNT